MYNMSVAGKRSYSPKEDENGTKFKKTETVFHTASAIPGSEQHLFSSFVVDKVLGESAERKVMFVQGHYGESKQPAVVVLEKRPFSHETIEGILGAESETAISLRNDIYHTLSLTPSKDYSGIKTTLIYPATQKHIDKYQHRELFILQETPEDYHHITEPYIMKEHFSIQWVYNILEKKEETDRIVFEDPDPETGFILLPDMKWDCKQLENLYLIAIVHKRGIKSLRDLKPEHLPLLKNIMHKGIEAIKEKYKLPSTKLRIFLHYQPSYYHFHVHFTNLSFSAPGCGVERGHLLTDIIENIELCGDYYAKKTLSFLTKEGDQLYQLFKANKNVLL